MSLDVNSLHRRAFLTAGLGAMGWQQVAAQAPAVPNPVKLGLVGSLFREIPSGLVLFAMQPFKEFLDAELGVSSKLVAGGDPIELGQNLRDGSIHVAVFHGPELAWAQARFPKLKPLFIAVNGTPTLTAHMIVRKGAAFRTTADLKDRSITIPSRTREHCWLFLERRCVKPGVKPNRYFASLRRTVTAEESLHQVAGAHSPAALIDGSDWQAYQADHPAKAAKLAPLVSSEPLPCAAVVCWEGMLDAALVTRFRSGMLGATRTPKGREMLKVMRITGFQEVPEDYDRQLVASAKAYPPVK